MPNDHQMQIDDAALDSLIKLGDGLVELEVTVGPQARPIIAEVRSQLAEAAARRAAGDMPAAIALIGQAMERLAALGHQVDAVEGGLMHMVAERFRQALNMGDKGAAKLAVNVMRHKAGDPQDEPNTDW
jgi:hypothetical protein